MLLQLTSFRLLYLILRMSSSVWDCAYLRLSVFSILVTNCIVWRTCWVRFSFSCSISRKLSIYLAKICVESSNDLSRSIDYAICCDERLGCSFFIMTACYKRLASCMAKTTWLSRDSPSLASTSSLIILLELLGTSFLPWSLTLPPTAFCTGFKESCWDWLPRSGMASTGYSVSMLVIWGFSGDMPSACYTSDWLPKNIN